MGANMCAGGRTETDICLGETFKGSTVHFKSHKSDLKRKVRRYRRKIERLESQIENTTFVCKRIK